MYTCNGKASSVAEIFREATGREREREREGGGGGESHSKGYFIPFGKHRVTLKRNALSINKLNEKLISFDLLTKDSITIRNETRRYFISFFSLFTWYRRISQMAYQPKGVGKMADFEILTLFISVI